MSTQDFDNTPAVCISVPNANEILEVSNNSANEGPPTLTHQDIDNSPHETNDANLEVSTTSANQVSDHSTPENNESTLEVTSTSTISRNIPIPEINWNQEIPQEDMDAFQFNFEGRDYWSALQEVFFTVFRNVKSDSYTILRYYSRTDNYQIERLLYIWINYFFPNTSFLQHSIYFLRPLTHYIVQGKDSWISARLQKEIFISFNIADQFITPHYFGRKTFIEDRLKTTIDLRQIYPNLSEDREISFLA